LSLNDKNEWQDIQTLIVYEALFISDKILEALDVKLNKIENRAKPFGGFSIIFAREFCQLEPVVSMEFDLMLSILSSKHYCFKEDPEYGEMLKRMWNGIIFGV
jgi:hypothetical protein